MAKKVSKSTRIKKHLLNVSENKLDDAKRIVEDLIYIEDKLEEARLMYAQELLVEEYDNGGGQTGTRVNPAIKAYQDLLRSYLNALDKLDAMKQTEERNDDVLIGLLDWSR